jgi:hypothetical protein
MQGAMTSLNELREQGEVTWNEHEQGGIADLGGPRR